MQSVRLRFSPQNNSQIVIDHTSVSQYSSIPSSYITEIKKMWIVVPGESHSQAYRTGLTLLETDDSTYSVNVVESGTPDAYTTSNLRASRATWGDVSNASGWRWEYGEEDWYTSSTAISRTKAGIDYCNTNSLTIGALGFGWCWDMSWGEDVGGTADPVTGNRWAGSSEGGPEGSHRWGLDSADTTLTGNSVCMDTYLDATQQYVDYCTTQGYTNTHVFFTTGPIDTYTAGERSYQRELKHEYIRDYVAADSSLVLFDYADILAWNNSGSENRLTWTSGKTYQEIHSDNLGDGTIGHIGEAGALRLGKAQWVLLARLLGWSGV